MRAVSVARARYWENWQLLCEHFREGEALDEQHG
jgi:hypothetical protein